MARPESKETLALVVLKRVVPRDRPRGSGVEGSHPGLPHLGEFSTERVLKPGYDFGAEFAFGLELLLDGLARSLDDQRDGRS